MRYPFSIALLILTACDSAAPTGPEPSESRSTALIAPALDYTLTTITSLVLPRGISDAGYILGTEAMSGRAAVWFNGHVTLLLPESTPFGATYQAQAIAPNGRIIGKRLGVTQALVMWATPSSIPVAVAQADKAVTVKAVNSAGTMVGVVNFPSGPRAFVQQVSANRAFPLVPVGIAIDATAIDEAGSVAGIYVRPNGDRQPVRWDRYLVPKMLDALGEALAINLLGAAGSLNGGPHPAAVLWPSSGNRRYVGPPLNPTTMDWSVATAINAPGRLVGTALLNYDKYIWTQSGNLYSLLPRPVPPGVSLFLRRPSVNGCGMIVAEDYSGNYPGQTLLWTKTTCDAGDIFLP